MKSNLMDFTRWCSSSRHNRSRRRLSPTSKGRCLPLAVGKSGERLSDPGQGRPLRFQPHPRPSGRAERGPSVPRDCRFRLQLLPDALGRVHLLGGRRDRSGRCDRLALQRHRRRQRVRSHGYRPFRLLAPGNWRQFSLLGTVMAIAGFAVRRRAPFADRHAFPCSQSSGKGVSI